MGFSIASSIRASAMVLCVSAGSAHAFDSFIATGPLVAPRYGANTEMLVDGNVLIADGRGLLGAESTAEIYDVASGHFSTTGPMVGAFTYRASAALANGGVLIVGGLADTDSAEFGTNHAEVFNPPTRTFSATGDLAAYGSYPGTRWAATATTLLDGRVLIVGGISHSGVLSDAQLYDPATGTFAVTGFMNTPRVSHTATRLRSGRVLVTGGTDRVDGGFPNQSAEIWDPVSATFTATGVMTSFLDGRFGATATLLNDGSVLVAGGEDRNAALLTSAERFDEASGTFTAVGNLGTARYGAGAALLADGKVLIVGGADPANPSNSIVSAEIYDPATSQFTPAANLASARSDASVIALRGGRVLCAGGDDLDGTPMSSAELYVANVIFLGSFDSN